MQPFISDLSRLPLWLLLLGLAVLVASAGYWIGQLGQHMRLPKPSTRVIKLLGGYMLSVLIAWCATTYVQTGLTASQRRQPAWNETHRLLFIAISLYLTPVLTRYLGKE